MMPAMLLSALCQLKDPAMLEVCDDLGKMASPFGLFCEYYQLQEKTMIGYSGGQRPWGKCLRGVGADRDAGRDEDEPDHPHADLEYPCSSFVARFCDPLD